MVIALGVVVLGLVSSAIRIVPQTQRLVVFRFGLCLGQRGPGLVILFPLGVDRGVAVDVSDIGEAVGRVRQAMTAAESGTVEITGQLWPARSREGPIGPDTEVAVIQRDGSTLYVVRVRQGTTASRPTRDV
jgi:regulator of protease activity HflC (stomatin/prohibitin superfamily)